MKKQAGPKITLRYTDEVHNIMLKSAKADNTSLPGLLVKKVIKLHRMLKENECTPCEKELSNIRNYNMQFPQHMQSKIECLSQRFNMQPATWIKRFIVDAEVIKYFQEQEKSK